MLSMLVYCIFAKNSFREVGLQIKDVNICICTIKTGVLHSYVHDIYRYNFLHSRFNNSLVTASKPKVEETCMDTLFSFQRHHRN
jgi:hypothetical protein